MFDCLSKKILSYDANFQQSYTRDNCIYLYTSLLNLFSNIVRNGGDTTNKLIKETSKTQITIAKFINDILLTKYAAGEEQILMTRGCPVVNIDYKTDLTPYQHIIDGYIAFCIHNKYILTLSDPNINPELANECINSQNLMPSYKPGGANKIFSKKITIYLKKIENIKNTIKLLKKNKILNRDKIIKNNKQIDDLKFKIKEEKKKEKEKLKKEKEKEKLKKKKKKNEKLKKEKEKGKTKKRKT